MMRNSMGSQGVSILINFWLLQLTFYVETSTDVQGRCPLYRPIQNHREHCSDDRDCPKGQKCCGGYVGTPGSFCADVEFDAHPGECPLNRPYQKYRTYCTDDHECNHNQKCCGVYNGSRGKFCAEVASPSDAHTGDCPLKRPHQKFRTYCTDHTECSYNQKCCGVYNGSRGKFCVDVKLPPSETKTLQANTRERTHVVAILSNSDLIHSQRMLIFPQNLYGVHVVFVYFSLS